MAWRISAIETSTLETFNPKRQVNTHTLGVAQAPGCSS